MLVDAAINCFRAGDYQEAERLCKEVIQNEPTNVRAYRMLGIIAHKHSKVDIAKQLLLKALELEH